MNLVIFFKYAVLEYLRKRFPEGKADNQYDNY